MEESHRDLLLLATIVLFHWEMRNLIFLNKYAIMMGIRWSVS